MRVHEGWLSFESLDICLCGSSLRSGSLREALGLPRYITAGQVHGTTVCRVRADEARDHIPNCDALITDQLGIGLVIQHADCQAALFYDPKRRAIGAAHSGWRGSVGEIYASVIAEMVAAFGTDPSDLIVAISPSIGPEGAEYRDYKTMFPPGWDAFRRGACNFDFWELSHEQLCSLGVPADQIEIARLCTWSDPDRFFSYRRDKTSERHETIIGMNT